jgi:opacity protein-like surface antigen
MKKIYTILIIAMIGLSVQNYAQTKISLGARAGLAFSNMSFSPDVSSQITKSSRTGFEFGAVAEFGFGKMFALQVEPMYATGGCKLSGPLFNNGYYSINGKSTYKLAYLEIPILFKVKIPVTGQVMPYAFAGPNIGINLSAKETDEPDGYASQENDQKDYVSSVNFALDFGAGASFALNKATSLMLDVRYSLGLSNILSDKGKQSLGSDQSIKTNGLKIIAGVLFAL